MPILEKGDDEMQLGFILLEASSNSTLVIFQALVLMIFHEDVVTQTRCEV